MTQREIRKSRPAKTGHRAQAALTHRGHRIMVNVAAEDMLLADTRKPSFVAILETSEGMMLAPVDMPAGLVGVGIIRPYRYGHPTKWSVGAMHVQMLHGGMTKAFTEGRYALRWAVVDGTEGALVEREGGDA